MIGYINSRDVPMKMVMEVHEDHITFYMSNLHNQKYEVLPSHKMSEMLDSLISSSNPYKASKYYGSITFDEKYRDDEVDELERNSLLKNFDRLFNHKRSFKIGKFSIHEFKDDYVVNVNKLQFPKGSRRDVQDLEEFTRNHLSKMKFIEASLDRKVFRLFDGISEYMKFTNESLSTFFPMYNQYDTPEVIDDEIWKIIMPKYEKLIYSIYDGV